MLLKQNIPVGKEYLRMVDEGLLAAQYIENWEAPPQDAVFLSPAHTFIMSNRSVDYQFWLDIGSLGWWERLNQPLTHPYVLSRNWPENRKWTRGDEEKSSQINMERLVSGLIRRCKKHTYLCAVGMNEQGKEERGPLIIAIQKILRKMQEKPS